MFKFILSITLLLLLEGCFSSRYYILSMPSTPKTHATLLQNETIGVEKVTVPKYLFKREIAHLKEGMEVLFYPSDMWAEDMDNGLTQRLIAFLQKKFQHPQVYAYPWGLDENPDIKIKVQVTRFIEERGRVYLDANWEISSMKEKRRMAKLFSHSLPSPSDASSVVETMNRLFASFEEDLARGVEAF